jgi:hypothetical protein
MAYKNMKKNKAHIAELRKDVNNWRFKERIKRVQRKKSALEKLLSR